MYLKTLSLVNYKNFAEGTFDFDSKVNCFVGPNGIGKTNVLDAIYHLSYGKSYFNPMSVQNIRHGADFFLIDGTYDIQARQEHIVCSLKKGQRKTLKRNEKPYEKFSDHIGLIPLVIISPADRDLITEGSDFRRKFMDAVISQLDAHYLRDLIGYERILQQRNALLKYLVTNRIHDQQTLDVYNAQLNDFGLPLFEKRKSFLEEFLPIFHEFHLAITSEAETVEIVYQSQLHQHNFLDLLNESYQRDKMLQYTSAGIHKDDLSFEINGYPIRKFGSQGQQKSFLIALKLAQFDFLKKRSNQNPILLFDDIFDKLDEYRVSKIIEMVNRDDFGQLFLSDTHSDRTKALLESTTQSFKLFSL